MKAKDVMKALAWHEVVGRNIGSVTMPYDEVKGIIALLREKDDDINRLKSEISVKRKLLLKCDDLIVSIRSQTINEFAERLKEKMNNLSRMEYDGTPYFLVSKSFIGKAAEEMKGEQE